MSAIEFQGRKIEHASPAYYEHVIGLTYSSVSLSSVFGNLQFTEDKEQLLTESHLDHFLQVSETIRDITLLESVWDLLEQFQVVQALNEKLLGRLASWVDQPIPRSQEGFRTLVYTLDDHLGPDWYSKILAEKATSRLMTRLHRSLDDMEEIKIRILDRILSFYPHLIDSEYINEQDRRILQTE